MMQSHRLQHGGRIDRTRPVEFTFNGARYQGYHGDTLASALLANGAHLIARSWKYHRPRGIVAAGVEEPNAVVQLESGPWTVPNARATEIELYAGLAATSINAEPDIERDRLRILGRLGRFIPAGFHYKTFMWPRRLWPTYEALIREAAGLGRAPGGSDPDRYTATYAHCDVLVVGAGAAGLAAAYAAARGGARVMLVDDQPEPGGSLLSRPAVIDGEAARAWVANIVAALRAQPEVTLLTRTTVFGYHDHNFLTACERLTDHLPVDQRRSARERLWKIRAARVVLATGAHERPIVFANNDLPGIMLASAVSSYIERYGVRPGRRAVVFTNNDGAYGAALDLKASGTDVLVVDCRSAHDSALPMAAREAGIQILNRSVVLAAEGTRHVRAVKVGAANGTARPNGVRTIECDLLCVSGGWNPALHLFAQSGGVAQWNGEWACFVPGASRQAERSVGAANGEMSHAGALREGAYAGTEAAALTGYRTSGVPSWHAETLVEAPLVPLWITGDRARRSRGGKQFVDFQNDVTAADIYLAAREGYASIEHMKRYTTLGLGTDQGKLGNINGIAILAEALGQTIPETGTTTFRPNYTPVTFGTYAGRELGALFDPVRTTCIHAWHLARGAVLEDAGTWKRARYYPRAGEDMHAAVARECRAVRTAVGIFDASTLGKIDLQGPDAATLLDRVYTNSWRNLEIGRCRYGIMLDENGMVFDDGVTTRLDSHHFLMSTTTGGAARVLDWIERWLQTEWPELKVYLTSVTDHFATFAIAGPCARRVLRKVCEDTDFSRAAFPFMSVREGYVAGVPARLMRISFSGELAYEVNVPANFGQAVWDAIVAAGEEYGITPYGTEAMHVLRAEKGHIIVGQDTDGSVTPIDLGMQALIAHDKDFLGRRSLSRTDTASPDRKQLVGLLAEHPRCVLPEGSQVVGAREGPDARVRIGHVTSSYMSPTLGRSIALALVRRGRERTGQSVFVSLRGGAHVRATVCRPVFYDPDGTRQHVE
jgi:sarcosine oxidase, subunit alpha